MTDTITTADVIERIRDVYGSCDPAEQDILKRILQEIVDTGESPTYEQVWLADYKEIPVSIDTFLNSDTYLGKTNRQGEAVYPFWRQELHNVFDEGNKFYEWILTGATRIGKTSTAITAAAYMLYRLMCLRDPQMFFGKKEISKFSLLFFNVTKDLAKGVAFREFNDTLKESPWFCAHGSFSRSEREFYYIPEGDKIIIDYGSDASHGLGQQVFCAIMDEVNFAQAGVKDVQKAKKKMKRTYDTLVARVTGTFKHGGQVFGKIFAVSSKNSDSDFMEDYVAEQLAAGAGDHMYISDAPQWEVLPRDTFSSETFTIAVGGRHLKSFVVPDNQCFPEALADLEEQGYRLLHPPVDMKSQFLADFNVALRDLAGIAVLGSASYFTQEMLTKCINTKRRNPFYSDILQIGVKDNLAVEDFFHIDELPAPLRRTPIYIHLDLALVNDRAGIAGAGITGRKDIVSKDGKTVSLPFFTHAFATAIEAPRGDKISFAKIVAFICWLRKSGLNIAGVSRDQFQSEYLAQQLEAQGFTVDKVSLDRTPDGYEALHSVLSDERIDLLDSKLLQDELIHLQRDLTTRKLDHPIGGCFTGDTEVLLADGRKAQFKDLMRNQKYFRYKIQTVNEATGEIEIKPIRKIFFSKKVKSVYQVTLNTGAVIQCTPEHRFMLEDNTYEEVQNIQIGDKLRSIDGKHTIVSAEKVQRQTDVYDMEVEDNPNFLLGAGIFVHNSKDLADATAGCIWNAIQKNPGVPVPVAVKAAAMMKVNGVRNDPRQNLLNRFNQYKKY